MSPSEDNILLNPVKELRKAITQHLFGLALLQPTPSSSSSSVSESASPSAEHRADNPLPASIEPRLDTSTSSTINSQQGPSYEGEVIEGKACILSNSYPFTEEEVESVRKEYYLKRSRYDVKSKSGGTMMSSEMEDKEKEKEIKACGRLGLIDGGDIEVCLDSRGYTITSSSSSSVGTDLIGTTYESLDAVLIAISPGYVRAMGEELARRFGGIEAPRWGWEEDDGDDGEEAETREDER